MLELELTIFFVWAIVALRNSYKSEKESMRWQLYWERKENDHG